MPNVGQRLGPYELIALLGKGGMGVVYQARDTRLDRPVAIKVLSDTSVDPNQRARFRREAKIIAGLQHPNICALYDVGRERDTDYLVMELLQGETLAERLERELLPVDVAIGYGEDIARALTAAHARSVIHGDLKPSNLMITSVGIKLLDFGLAKRNLPSGSTASTATGLEHNLDMMAGTLPYMAPEQIQQRTTDARSDIFSFGVTFYEMLSGQRPFTASFSLALMAEILQSEPRNIRELRPDVPSAVAAIVRKCLQKPPARRWQTAAKLESALTRCSDTVPTRRRKKIPQHRRRLRSIAVLPFECVSGPDDEFLADGISEALAISLGRGSTLSVVARSSTIRFKASHKSEADIGNELRVDAVVSGSVARSRDRVRVVLQVIDVRSNTVLWARRFDRHIAALSDAQREIADAISSELNVRLTVSRGPKSRTRQIGLEGQESYLRGRYYLNLRTAQALRQSFAYLRRCVQLEPEFAPGHVALAQWYVTATMDRLVPASEAIPKAKAAALEALRHDMRSAEAQAALGYIALYEWDVNRAMTDLRTAVTLDRNNPEAYRHLARACCFVEEYRDAFELVRIAQRLDPMSPSMAGATVALGAGDWELAVRECHRAIELAPASPHGYYELGLAEHFRGLHDSAMEHMRRAVHLSDRHPSTLVGLAMLIAHRDPRSSELDELLNELRDAATRAEATPWDFAEFYAGVGDIERAMRYLKRGVELRLPEMIGIRADPMLRSVRSHPEFGGLLDAIGLRRDELPSTDESRTVASIVNKLTQ
jgi:serine/threonine protein kinase/Flp pilus assembly protein TadD